MGDAKELDAEKRVEGIADAYLDQLQRGESPDRAALLAAHPDIAAPLAKQLDFVDLMHRAQQAMVSTDASSAADSLAVPEPAPALAAPPPDRIGRYHILQALGRGAAGTVYRAYDPKFDRDVPYWEASYARGLLGLLDSQRPERTSGPDLRGFEWYYWHRLFHADQLTLKEHTKAVYGVAVSPDGRMFSPATFISPTFISSGPFRSKPLQSLYTAYFFAGMGGKTEMSRPSAPRWLSSRSRRPVSLSRANSRPISSHQMPARNAGLSRRRRRYCSSRFSKRSASA